MLIARHRHVKRCVRPNRYRQAYKPVADQLGADMVLPTTCAGVCARCIKNKQMTRERFCTSCGRDHRRPRRCSRCGVQIRPAYVKYFCCLCDRCAPEIRKMIRITRDEIERQQQQQEEPPMQVSEADRLREARIDAAAQETQHLRMLQERRAWEAIMGELPGIEELIADEGCQPSSPHGFATDRLR